MFANVLFFSALPVTTALHDYVSHEAGDLSFKKGDKITIIDKINKDWLEGELNGQKGMLPSAYVEYVEFSDTTQNPKGKASCLSSLPLPFFPSYLPFLSFSFLYFIFLSLSFSFLSLNPLFSIWNISGISFKSLVLVLFSQSKVINISPRNICCPKEKPCMTLLQSLIVNSPSRYVCPKHLNNKSRSKGGVQKSTGSHPTPLNHSLSSLFNQQYFTGNQTSALEISSSLYKAK